MTYAVRRPRWWTFVAQLSGVMVIVLFTGCTSTTPAPTVNQPPVISQYKAWTVRVTPSVVQTSPALWKAHVRVWPPEVLPQAHPGIELSFDRTAANREAIEQAATAAARAYIDASIPMHAR